MRSALPGLRWSVILVCLLFFSILAQDTSRKERSGSASAADEAALLALAQEFYAAYSKRDLDGFLRLWSARAPELAARRQTMEKLFADHEKIEVKGLAPRKITVEGEMAKLRVEVEMSAIEAKTGKPAAGFGKMIRTLQIVKEGGNWKTWHEAMEVENLAGALAVVKSEVERSAILTAEHELVTENLVRELSRQGNRLQLQGNYPDALDRFHLAQNVAERIGDRTGIADALRNIGYVHYNQGRYAQALEHFQKSLALSEALGDTAGIGRTLNNIGIVHSSQGGYARAMEHFQKSLTLSEALADKAECVNNFETPR